MIYKITVQCINCGICVAVCPVEAIEEGEHRPFIDINSCISCDLCRVECPVPGAIVVSDDGEENG